MIQLVDRMEDLLQEVLGKIRPREEDRKRLREVANKVIERAKRAASELEIPAEPAFVGSAARRTWIREERDIDIFLLLPEHLTRKELEEKGLAIARKITKGKGKEQYAEHPYITAKIEGFDVDLVPCYDIEDPREVRSAVDRSPHHQRYVTSQLTPELADQVLLLKKFLKSIGAYGAELRIHGFSGYLCELLIIHFGSFLDVIHNASRWGPEPIIDLKDEHPSREDVRRLFPDQPFVFIDPVDPSRNVAAAVSKKNLATFIRACQDFKREPSINFFFPETPSLSLKKMKNIIKARGTKFFAIVFDTPADLVPDIVYPQLRKTERTLLRRLENAGFRVLRSDVSMGKESSIIILELIVSELPNVREHQGPPLGPNPKPFIEKYVSSSRKFAGPFIDKSGRLIFELKREKPLAKEILISVLESRAGFGKHVAESVREGYELIEDGELVELAEEGKFRQFLIDYLTLCLPWYR